MAAWEDGWCYGFFKPMVSPAGNLASTKAPGSSFCGMGMILHAILKGCVKMAGYLITSDTPLIYFHQQLHLHDSVAKVRYSVTTYESSLISLRKQSASENALSIPTPPKVLPLFRKHISLLSNVLAEGHTCLQYLSASIQHHYTYIFPFNEAVFESTSTGKGKDCKFIY